jgi:hypothetical protein
MINLLLSTTFSIFQKLEYDANKKKNLHKLVPHSKLPKSDRCPSHTKNTVPEPYEPQSFPGKFLDKFWPFSLHIRISQFSKMPQPISSKVVKGTDNL